MGSNNQHKSDKLILNTNHKRISLLLTIIFIYLVILKDTNVFVTLSTGFAESDHEKLQEEQQVKSIQVYPLTASNEPYWNRWQRRFTNTSQTPYFFFKHIRKAGGTSLRSYFRDVFAYHGVTYITRDEYSKVRKGNESPDVLYVEHEFQTMDPECAVVDDRWNRSLTVITLRHPIERHMSEFFFSGHGTKFPIDRTQLYTNKTYTQDFSSFLNEYIPLWMEQEGGGMNTVKKYGEYDRRFNMYFGRFYTNNFQLRALAGCSSLSCMTKKLVDDAVVDLVQRSHPLTNVTMYQNPKPTCTQYFHKQDSLFDPCAKSKYKHEECESGCDGPCFYPSVAWGSLDQSDVARAIQALEKFDIVLLMETFDDPDQTAYMADVLGVPRDAEFALSKHKASYVRVQKTNKRDKTHFYRDMLLKLSPASLDKLTKQNELEIDFFEAAVEVNQQKTKEWMIETNWNDDKFR